jgi:hypothetical protein
MAPLSNATIKSRPSLKKTAHFSAVDPMVWARVSGIEALAEATLQRASDTELSEAIYLLHDVFIADKNPKVNDISFYFDQPKQHIDGAIALFRAHRHVVCDPHKVGPNEHPLLQLYLLFDCLYQVGAISRRCRQMGYLSKRSNYKWRIGLDEFIKNAPFGRMYNYAVVKGQPLIGPSHRYHSEIADGQPVQAVGQIAKIGHPDGTSTILVSNETGHYRVPYKSIYTMLGIIAKAIDRNLDTANAHASPKRPDVPPENVAKMR